MAPMGARQRAALRRGVPRKELRRRRELVDALREAQKELAAAVDQVVVAACESLEFNESAAASAWAELAEDEERLGRAYEGFTEAGAAAAEHLKETS